MDNCHDFVMPENNPTKMGNLGNWKEKAYIKFFLQNKKIIDIASELGKTRKTISTYLSTFPEYQDEKERRKFENKERRKVSQKEWDRTKRNRNDSFVEGALLRRQHFIDVAVLSADRH